MNLMKSQTVKTLGGVMSAVALISGGAGMAVAAPAVAAPVDAAPITAADEASGVVDAVRAVEGTFSFTQDAVTSNADLSGVFSKAAATLCAALPTYSVEAVSSAIQVTGPEASFEATVADMAADEDAVSYQMACACASNVPGGGAIANAEVEGVSLETLVMMALA
ncbi:MAG: hypothetical protein HFJ66_03955 [Eggerthellaceae bacterium]|nr:hypothetical protein [Eggerthellaceae bacterium]